MLRMKLHEVLLAEKMANEILDEKLLIYKFEQLTINIIYNFENQLSSCRKSKCRTQIDYIGPPVLMSIKLHIRNLVQLIWIKNYFITRFPSSPCFYFTFN